MHAASGPHSNANDCTQSLAFTNGLGVNGNDRAVQTDVVAVATSGIADHTTYRIVLHLADSAENVYAIGGDSRPMFFPPAYQTPSPVSYTHLTLPTKA